MKRTAIAIALILTAQSADANRIFSETHTFRVYGEITYHCLVGAGKKKTGLSRMGVACDSKDAKQVIVDKSVPLQVKFNPTPDNDMDLKGAWEEKYPFKGRMLRVGIDLFKSAAANYKAYTIRLTADDDTPGASKTVVVSQWDLIEDMNATTTEYTATGGNDEIEWRVTVKPDKPY